MVNLRYIELSKPIHQRIARLGPKTRRILHFMEAGLVTVLFSSLILYM